jgi:membrane protein YdbS with pleckstrin-like domain
MTRDFSPQNEGGKPMLRSDAEEVRLDERRHAIVLAGPFVRALALAVGGACGFVLGWPLSAVGAVLLAIGAAIAVQAVWRWDRTHVVLTTEKLFVVHGTVRRRAAAVRLERVGPVEVEQSLLGRLFGYGTVVAGDLEITHVPDPRRLVERLAP